MESRNALWYCCKQTAKRLKTVKRIMIGDKRERQEHGSYVGHIQMASSEPGN